MLLDSLIHQGIRDIQAVLKPNFQTLQLLQSHSCWGLRARRTRLLRPWGSGDQQGALPSFLLQLKCEHVKCTVAVALWGPDATAEPSLQSCPPETPLLVGMFSCTANAWAGVICSQVCSVAFTTTFPRCVSPGSLSHAQGDTVCCTLLGRSHVAFLESF